MMTSTMLGDLADVAQEGLVAVAGITASLFVIVRFIKADKVWQEQAAEYKARLEAVAGKLDDAEQREEELKAANEVLFDENRKWRIRIVALEVWIRSNGGDPSDINGPAGGPLTKP